jgi:cobalt-precorrin-5B (C1)-methyltransferase
MSEKFDASQLRRGWTTGACATAASKAAYAALLTGHFPDPVPITLPSGAEVDFALAQHEMGEGFARAGIVKDAGDDPDVTHGALVLAKVRFGPKGSGVQFRAGAGVGTVTRPGLPLAVGEPAINPVPRAMMTRAIAEVAQALGANGDVVIEISIPDGEQLAERTLNGRLGIIGGLSILGTTGIVVPFSCAAWINSIHRGIDVAKGMGLTHIAGSTGSTSESAVQKLYHLPEQALIDMGDFVGGMLKYIRKHPVEVITIAGGMGKMTKLGQGLLDLHSRRGEVDLNWLADLAPDAALAASIRAANSAKHAFELADAAQFDLAPLVAARAWDTAAKALQNMPCTLEIVIFNRDGALLARYQAEVEG